MQLCRSGDFSLDPTFDVEELFAPVTREVSRRLIEDAFRGHLGAPNVVEVARAIAVYVRTSRQRGHAIEHVVRDLESIQTRVEGPHAQALPLTEPTSLRQAVLHGILLAFYGAEIVAREDRRRGDRRKRRV